MSCALTKGVKIPNNVRILRAAGRQGCHLQLVMWRIWRPSLCNIADELRRCLSVVAVIPKVSQSEWKRWKLSLLVLVSQRYIPGIPVYVERLRNSLWEGGGCHPGSVTKRGTPVHPRRNPGPGSRNFFSEEGKGAGFLKWDHHG